MKFFVNERCIGCGLCAGVCPEVFSMNADGMASAEAGDVPSSAEAKAMDAKDGCPVAAIEKQQEDPTACRRRRLGTRALPLSGCRGETPARRRPSS